MNQTLDLTGKDKYKSGSTSFYLKFSILSIYVIGTIRKWLHYCGFSVRETKKAIYYDGHEREDVVQVQNVYIACKVII